MIDDSLKLETWDETDWQYIQGLSQSVESVKRQYIRDLRDEKKKYYIERIFSYELYHKWSQNLSKVANNPSKLFLNAELTKHYNHKETFPDFVLHGDYTNQNKQFIICEVKSSRNYVNDNALKKDIKTLMNGMSKLGYHCGVFIYLGSERSTIEQRIERIKAKTKDVHFKILLIKVIDYNKVDYTIL